MPFSFSVLMSLTATTSLLLFAALQYSQYACLFSIPRTLLKRGFLVARGNLALRLMLSFLALLSPFYALFIEAVKIEDFAFPLIALPVFISLFAAPELHTEPNARLVITKPLLSRTATLHLKSPYQGFDRQTYRELFALVESLPQHGIDNISLNSPMFYDNKGTLRDMNVLENGLNKRHARLSHSPAGTFDCLLGKISMLISSDPRKKAQLNKINMTKWHCITIELGD